MRGVPRLRRAISLAPAIDLDVQEAGGADDDLLELVGVVVIEAFADGKAGEQGGGEEAAAGGGADEGEAGEV